MPMFGKKTVTPEPESGPAPKSALSAEQILNLLGYELERSRRYGRPLSILRIVPQTLPGEVPRTAEINATCEAARGQLRDIDHLGLLDDHTLLAVLPETAGPGARVVANRIKSDLTIRSAGGQQRNWLVGSSTLWDDGDGVEELLATSSAHALDRAS